jgi:hypothetical protein
MKALVGGLFLLQKSGLHTSCDDSRADDLLRRMTAELMTFFEG